MTDFDDYGDATVKPLYLAPISDETGRVMIDVQINSNEVRMQLDTGAMASLASASLWEQLGRPRLEPAPRLPSYGGETVSTIV